MKEIKKDITIWKANETKAVVESVVGDIHYSSGVIFGLELALKRIEQKNNKKLQTDACRQRAAL